MAVKSQLSIIALLVKNGNPQAFGAFVAELENYERSLVDELVQASTTEILSAAGRVQSIRALLRVLKECHLEPKKQPVPEEPVPAS